MTECTSELMRLWCKLPFNFRSDLGVLNIPKREKGSRGSTRKMFDQIDIKL